MPISSLEQFNAALKSLIFELTVSDLSSTADRLNRVAFEDHAEGDTEHLLELASVLRDIRNILPLKLRDPAERCELFARNYRRLS